MAAPKRHRKRHPGVVLIKPEGRHGWRARYRDPDSNRIVKVGLNPALRTAELREDWAAKKSRELAKRRLELEGGAVRATGTGLDAALDRYLEDHGHLRPGTLGIYKAAIDKLRSWARAAGLKSADELTGAKLVALRASLAKERMPVPTAGGRRGQRTASTAPRSPQTINRELRALRTVLGYLRKLGLAARLSSDDLKDGLERMRVSHERGDFLRPAEIGQLLDAALAHDARNYVATRAEHAGIRPPGMTPRYGAIAPLLAAALLTGMRYAELLELDWSAVDLDAPGEDGKPAGEIHLAAADTKTHHARDVDLEVSPTLRELLLALRPKDARGKVWGLTDGEARAAARRLDGLGAPEGWSWQALRRTCGTVLTCAPTIYGAASAYRSARRLGHSVAVAEKHYSGVMKGISRDARTLEAAMQIEPHMARIIAAVKDRAERAKGAGRVEPRAKSA